MPIIKLIDGTLKRVTYGSAAQLNQYLNEPEKLNEIKDADERAKKEEFLSQVESIDWSDIDRPKSNGKSFKPKENAELKRVLADTSLKGKAKFDAVRLAMTGRNADGSEPKYDDIP